MFHTEKPIFDRIRAHLLILLFNRDQTRASKGLLRKKAIKFEVEVLDTVNIYRICLIYDEIKSKTLLSRYGCGDLHPTE